MTMASKWNCVLEAKAQVGECPIYAHEQHAVYWVDAYAPSINCLDLRTGANRSWKLPRTIGSYGLAADLRSCVAALADGLYRVEFASGALTKLHNAPYDVKHYRFNDGRVDRAGRFWVGTLRRFSSQEPEGRGAFWRMEGERLVRAIDGVTIANGIAWSPDDRTMYIADRPNWQILAFDFDIANGAVSNRRTFARVPEGIIPDGAAVDEEGCYWVAHPRAGKVVRYGPGGELLREIPTPVSCPTMVAFGGESLKTLFITSARALLTGPGELDREPQAGAIFSLEVEARGVSEPRLK